MQLTELSQPLKMIKFGYITLLFFKFLFHCGAQNKAFPSPRVHNINETKINCQIETHESLSDEMSCP